MKSPPNQRSGFPGQRLYDVYIYAPGGVHRGPGFLHLDDALRHVDEHLTEGSFAIMQPDGQWYRTDSGLGRGPRKKP